MMTPRPSACLSPLALCPRLPQTILPREPQNLATSRSLPTTQPRMNATPLLRHSATLPFFLVFSYSVLHLHYFKTVYLNSHEFFCVFSVLEQSDMNFTLLTVETFLKTRLIILKHLWASAPLYQKTLLTFSLFFKVVLRSSDRVTSFLHY
ncbi:hypothetical protein E2C01_077830 [Portunus trituberculatus]|uniref:Uncharacterized protein n=1 Tax=Portunus trituberculatus TaxID=210409 RepID=A0A5B7IN25_PORTR|nr:hypothetical protein [Portunus trituberculatus]